MFRDNPDLLDLLHSSISNVVENLQDKNKTMIPDSSKLLLALSRCPPEDVKVVLLGHGPISDASLATGFAFSFPKEKFSDEKYKLETAEARKRGLSYISGTSLAELHQVLVEAGYLERGADYDGCHEVWADRGVLLLNAALTYDKEHEHFSLWKDFVTRLLFLVALYSQHKPVFFMCWGDNARDISKQLLPQLMFRYPVQKIGDGDHGNEVDGTASLVVFTGHHPTWPRKENGNQFRLQATNQFIAIKKWHPDLFQLPKLTKEDLKEDVKEKATYFEKKRAFQTIGKEQPPPKDEYDTLDRKEQIIILRLRTGHNRLNKHMHRLHLTVSPMCACGQDEQTAAHVLQICPLYDHQRRKFWPSGLAFHSKIYGPRMELLTTIEFIKRTHLTL
ncbi:hypothetical protein BsWGS_26238 [Bradybaena similaris]